MIGVTLAWAAERVLTSPRLVFMSVLTLPSSAGGLAPSAAPGGDAPQALHAVRLGQAGEYSLIGLGVQQGGRRGRESKNCAHSPARGQGCNLQEQHKNCESHGLTRAGCSGIAAE